MKSLNFLLTFFLILLSYCAVIDPEQPISPNLTESQIEEASQVALVSYNLVMESEREKWLAKPPYRYISKPSAFPHPSSTDYINISETVLNNATKKQFNTGGRVTRQVIITGNVVVIDKDNDKNGIYSRFNGQDNIEFFEIEAAKIIIRSPLHLPQTTITFHAEELVFEDPADGHTWITTTPRQYETPAANATASTSAEDGQPGHHAGNITLHVSELTIPTPHDPEKKRFVMRGGKGQNPGKGLKGDDGRNMPSRGPDGKRNLKRGSINPGGSIVFIQNGGWGAQAWPGDGQDAKPAGTPGVGGNGGKLTASKPVAKELVAQEPGSNGSKEGDVPGGAPGQPNPAYWIKHYSRSSSGRGLQTRYYYETIGSHEQKPGKDAAAPTQSNTGKPGTIEFLDLENEHWLTEIALRATTNHITDAYLAGNNQYANSLIQHNLKVLMTHPKRDTPEFIQLTAELQSMAVRIASGLDYFGNPAGWVPTLSLGYLSQQYQNEIRSAMKALYFAFWMERSLKNNQDLIQQLNQNIQIQQSELKQHRLNFSYYNELLPKLQQQAADIALKEDYVRQKLEQKKKDLLREARDRHKIGGIKQAARALSAIAMANPVGDPVIAGIGTWLNFATRVGDMNVNDLSSTFQQFGELKDPFTAENYKQREINAKAFEEKLKFFESDNQDTKEVVKNRVKVISELGKSFAPMFEALSKSFATLPISNQEIQQEFEALKQSNPEYNELVKEVAELMAQKTAFIKSANKAASELSKSVAQVQDGVTLIGELWYAKSEATAKTKHRILAYSQDMKRKAEQRLLKYQYYYAKAFEYNTLQPYPGNFTLNRLRDQAEKLIAENQVYNDNVFQSLESIYLQEIRQSTDIFLENLEFERTTKETVQLTLNESELKRLNETGEVRVNLWEKGLILLNWKNVRVSVSSLDLEVSPHRQTTNEEEPGSKKPLTVSVQYADESTLMAEDGLVKFNYYPGSGKVKPIQADKYYNLYTNKPTSTELSPDFLAFLRYLIQDGQPIPDEKLRPFILPSAMTDLIIIRNENSAKLENVSLNYTLYFKPKSKERVTLDVRSMIKNTASTSVSPYIYLSTEDNQGLKDGLAGFTRVYPKNSSIELIAQPIVGNYEFQGWIDGKGEKRSSDPYLKLELNTHQSIYAEYVPIKRKQLAKREKNPAYHSYALDREPEPRQGWKNAVQQVYQYIDRNFPEVALAANMEGIVFAQLTIDQKGRLKDVSIVKGPGYGLNAIARNVISKHLKHWKPNEINGKKVTTLLTVPIRFKTPVESRLAYKQKNADLNKNK